MKKILLWAVAVLTAVSCQFNQAEWVDLVKLAANHNVVKMPSSAPADSGVFIYSNKPYDATVVEGSEWLDVSLASADTLAFTLRGNNGFKRSALIRLTSGDRSYDVAVRQPGAYTEYINFVRASMTIPGEGGRFSAGLQTNLLERDLSVDVSSSENIKNVSLSGNQLSFDVEPSRHLENRSYTITVYTTDGWGDVVKKDLRIIQEPVTKRKIKVLYHNIYLRKYGSDAKEYTLWGYRLPGIVKMLAYTDPDVFGLNECDDRQRKDIEDAFPGYAAMGVCTDGTTSGYLNASNPIFYKTTVFECESWGTFWLSDTPDAASYTWEPLSGGPLEQRRNCTWAKLLHRRTGTPILFAVTHLANGEAGARSRELSIPLLLSKLQEMAPDTPVILGGDFNSSLGESFVKPLREWMDEARNACLEADKGMTYNGFSVPSGSSILDHIFYRKLLGDIFTIDRNPYADIQYISDHYPVWAALRIPEE